MNSFKLIQLAVFVFIFHCVNAQKKYNLPPNKFYPQATIGFKDFKKKKVRDLEIFEDSISYISLETHHTVSFDTINYIRIKTGTKAGGGALLGGGSMLLISLLSVFQVQADPDYELKENAGQTVILLTAGGTALGGIIGSFITKERSYYIHAKNM